MIQKIIHLLRFRTIFRISKRSECFQRLDDRRVPVGIGRNAQNADGIRGQPFLGFNPCFGLVSARSFGNGTAGCGKEKGKEPLTYLHPDLEPILKETYGTLVYQEQILLMQKICRIYLGSSRCFATGGIQEKPRDFGKRTASVRQAASRRGYEKRWQRKYMITLCGLPITGSTKRTRWLCHGGL